MDDADVKACEAYEGLESIQILRRVDDDVAPRLLGDCFVKSAVVVGEYLRILAADVECLQFGISGGLESLIHFYPEWAGRQVVRTTSAWGVEVPNEHLHLADADHLRVGADKQIQQRGTTVSSTCDVDDAWAFRHAFFFPAAWKVNEEICFLFAEL